MNNSKILDLKKPAEISADPLTELQRNGTRKLIAEAVEAEQGRKEFVAIEDNYRESPLSHKF